MKLLFKTLLLIILYLLLPVSAAKAVKQELKFKAIKYDTRRVSTQDSTISGLGPGKLKVLGSPQEWGIITVSYDSRPEWADNVEVKYYVMMRGAKKDQHVMLDGNITYMSVKKGQRHISTIYVPPQILERYGKVLRVRAELWYNGLLQDSTQWPRSKNKIPWWTRIKPASGSLLNRYYTPFEHEEQLTEELIKIE